MLMTDIETFAAEPAGAAIISVGAVIFTETEVLDTAEWKLDPRWSPGIRTKDTYEWWSGQDPLILRAQSEGAMLPWHFCEAYSEFCAIGSPTMAWANPSRFDHGHLRELYHALGHRFPFSYKIERDQTTLLWAARYMAEVNGGADALATLNDDVNRIRDSNQSEHSALADAIEQVRVVQFILRLLHT